MESVIAAVIGAVLSLIAVIFFAPIGKRRKKGDSEPPDNKAADIARGTIQQSLDDEIDKIDRATGSDSASSDLADLGNARRRR